MEYLAAQRDDFSEAIFTNERQELTEGSISNLLLFDRRSVAYASVGERGSPRSCAKAGLLESGQVREAILRLADLERTEAVVVCKRRSKHRRAVASVQLRDGRLLQFDTTIALP